MRLSHRYRIRVEASESERKRWIRSTFGLFATLWTKAVLISLMKISCVLSEEEVNVDHMERVEFHMIDNHDWVEYALCAEDEPDSLFVQGAAQRQVRMRCMECPVRLECLADALQSQMSYGVWGGLTERERRVILRVYPEKTDWSEWLMHSQDPLAVELRKPRVPQSLSMKHLRTNAKALREASLSVAARG